MDDRKSRGPLWLALILSLSVLILIIIVYCCERGNNKTPSGEENYVSAASVVRETVTEAYNRISEKITIAVEKARIRKAERKAQKARKKAEKERETQMLKENILGEKYYIKDENGIETDEYIELEAVSESEPEKYTIYKSEDGNRYIKRLGYLIDGNKAEYRYIPVRNEIDGVSFYEAQIVMYAHEEVPLYGNPLLGGDPILKAGHNEMFTAIGMSAKAVYQLVTSEGQIVYADGRKFGRMIELDDYTETIEVSSDKALLEVENLKQRPELPTGCEVTSLATVLNYCGFDVTKETLSDKFLPKASVGQANFYEEFVGNPRIATAYGCYAPVVVKTANAYLSDQDTDYEAVDYSGCTFSYLLDKVAMGYPAIVWVTAPITEEPTYTSEWIVKGEYLHWKGNLHCLVVTGYDVETGAVTTSDPLRGTVDYDMELFIKRFKQMNSQVVILEKR